jgi:DNA repair photolyase
VSNRVDPFAKSNYRQFLPVLETMTALGIPVMFQTKGGDGIPQALAMLKSPTVWYITIETDSNERAKSVAPGAPNIDQRFELIELLKSRGHHVIVGVNPSVPEWFTDVRAFLQRIQDAGVWGIWTMEMHLNSNQYRRLSKRAWESMGEDVIAKAKIKDPERNDFSFAEHLNDVAVEIGLQPFSVGQARYSDIWRPFKQCYEHLFPTVQDWQNQYMGMPEGTVIKRNDYVDWFVERLPKGVYQLGHYVCSMNYSLCMKKAKEDGVKWNHNMNFRRLIGMAWDDTRITFSPGSLFGMGYAVDVDGTPYWDESGHAYLVWRGGAAIMGSSTVELLFHPETLRA